MWFVVYDGKNSPYISTKSVLTLDLFLANTKTVIHTQYSIRGSTYERNVERPKRALESLCPLEAIYCIKIICHGTTVLWGTQAHVESPQTMRVYFHFCYCDKTPWHRFTGIEKGLLGLYYQVKVHHCGKLRLKLKARTWRQACLLFNNALSPFKKRPAQPKTCWWRLLVGSWPCHKNHAA